MQYAIRPRNWAKFQHYNKRQPPWIKLHRSTLDDFNFHRLPDASRALAPMLWLLASEHESGEIRTETAELAFRLRQESAWIDAAIKPLIDARFFEKIDNASALLVGRTSYATSESERETETETETESPRGESGTRKNGSIGLDLQGGSARDFIQEAVDVFNEHAARVGWSKVQNLNPARSKKLAGRLEDAGGIEGWRFAMERAAASDFLTGKKKGVDWRADFDFFLRPSKFTVLMEGTYDNRDKPASSAQDRLSPRARAIAGIRAAGAR